MWVQVPFLAPAGMAELVDALDSGSSEGSFMKVQVLLPAPKNRRYRQVSPVFSCGIRIVQPSCERIGEADSFVSDLRSDTEGHQVLLPAPKKQEIPKGVFCFFLVVEGLPNVHVKINKILDPQNTVFRFTFLGECVIMYTDQRQNTPQNESS